MNTELKVRRILFFCDRLHEVGPFLMVSDNATKLILLTSWIYNIIYSVFANQGFIKKEQHKLTISK